jgi:hypothetical protein
MAYSADQAAPGVYWRPITPSDTVNMAAGCRGVYCGGAGNIAAVGNDNAVATFTAVPVGTFLPICPKRINSTNTTATLLIALY